MKDVEIIAIDHGWSMCKTPNDIYISGVSEITTEPAYFDNVLEYKGRYYKVGSGRTEVKATKVETPDYYYLTLAGIAKELKHRNKTDAKVILSVGLPASRYGDEKNDFIKYLKQNDELYFKFEQIKYHVWIKDVYVYPQCYAAVMDQLKMFGPKVVVVDIGSWTIDIIPVIDKRPDEAGTDSIQQGIITCMRNINKECVRQFGEGIDEELIKEYMVTKKSMLPDKYIQVMNREIKSFLTMVVNSLREEKYSLKTTPFVFVGGGAVVMKNFGGFVQENFSYNTDICANAKGFECLAKYRLSMEVRNGGS
jgi:plasmid segregation protein ParM